MDRLARNLDDLRRLVRELTVDTGTIAYQLSRILLAGPCPSCAGRSGDPATCLGAKNLRHLAGCIADRWLLGPVPARARDDLRIVGLKLIFLIVTRAVSLLGLSPREWWWKDAEILMLRVPLQNSARGL